MKTKLITAIATASVAVAIPLAASAAANGECGENLAWALDDNGVLTISGSGDMYDYTSGNKNPAPWDAYSVDITSIVIEAGATSIGSAAFDGCWYLTDVVIPDTVTRIGNEAFYECDIITEISLPDSITYIGCAAFEMCNKLTTINLPEGLTELGADAFKSCGNLKSIVIPSTLECIPFRAFEFCDDLQDVIISDGVKIIDESAFASCESIASITIPDSVTTIYSEAFGYCDNLTSITLPDTITIISNTVFDKTEYYNNKNNWENGVLYVGKYLIDADKYISGNCSIRDGVICIASSAFSDCDYLTGITLPASVKVIGAYALNCDSLTEINVDSSNAVFSSVDGVMFSKDKSILIICPSGSSDGYTIPDGTAALNDRAFYDCKKLNYIAVPASITKIGKYALYGCDALTDIYYAGSEEDWSSIGIDKFNDSLDNVTMHFNSVAPTPVPTATPDPALDSVASGECGDDIKWALSKDGVIIVYGSGDMTDYSIRNNRSPWYDYSDSIKKIVIDSGVTSVGDYTFAYCHNVEEIIISETVENIGAYAFRNCRTITEISIPVSVTEIGNGAFYSSTGLTDIYYGGSKSDWDNIAIAAFNAFNSATVHYAIEDPDYSPTPSPSPSPTPTPSPSPTPTPSPEPDYTCGESLTWKFDNGVLTISGSGDMYDWEWDNTAPWKSYNGDITQVIIEDGVTSIGDYAFSVCDAMTTVTLPKSLTSIGESAFGKCTALTDVYYNGSEEDWSKIATETDNAPLLGAAIHFTVPYKINEILRNDGTVSANISKNTDEGAVLVVAAYNDGRLVEVKSCDISDISGDKTIDIEMDALTPDKVAAFIWKSITSMEPVVEASGI